MSHSWLSISSFTILSAAELCDYGTVPLDHLSSQSPLQHMLHHYCEHKGQDDSLDYI